MNILILQKIQIVKISKARYGKFVQYFSKNFETCLIRVIRENPWFEFKGSVPVNAVIRTKGHAREG